MDRVHPRLARADLPAVPRLGVARGGLVPPRIDEMEPPRPHVGQDLRREVALVHADLGADRRARQPAQQGAAEIAARQVLQRSRSHGTMSSSATRWRGSASRAPAGPAGFR